jgi:hypothetical protein
MILIFASSALPPAQAFAQEKCETALAEAQSMYEAGGFSPAIVRLSLCVPDQIPPEQKQSAYRLLAICYLNEDYREEARTAIRKIFDLNRQYETDAVQDPQPYRDLVAEVKAALPTPLSEKLFGGVKKWLWIGGATTGAVLAAIFWPPNEEPDLPEPPGLSTQ